MIKELVNDAELLSTPCAEATVEDAAIAAMEQFFKENL